MSLAGATSMRTAYKYKNVAIPSNLKPNLRRCPPGFSIFSRHTVGAREQAPGSPCCQSSKASLAQEGKSDFQDYADEGQQGMLGQGRKSATNWYDAANANIGEYRSNPLEDEPPFHIAPLPEDHSGDILFQGRGGLTGNATTSTFLRRNDSENEDLRSVIDDLTIENKRLLQRLECQERSYHPTLQQDRLFEVRIHDLAGPKKRELEELLRTFSSSLEKSATYPVQSLKHSDDIASAKRQCINTNPSFADSAYASISHSGPTSVDLSNRGKPPDPQSAASNNRNVHSYLHNIPESLLPKQSPAMTEKAKMKLVVKRLEQLFSGRRADPGEHTFPEQQQEVSNRAAHQDAVRLGTIGRKYAAEGSREAPIMPQDAGDTTESSMANWRRSQSQLGQLRDERDTSSTERGSSTDHESTPGQRPTRPLDLDIHRAQIPTENIDYIRHLGLSPPRINPNRSPNSPDGWVYLNLLISMAQLHTINVTPEFIRKAVTQKSSKFELSIDGSMMRWKGGLGGTHLSSDSSTLAETESDESHVENGNYSEGRERCRNNTPTPLSVPSSAHDIGNHGLKRKSSELDSTAELPGLAVPPSHDTNSRFVYKPLFFNRRHSNSDEEYLANESDWRNGCSGQHDVATGLETKPEPVVNHRYTPQTRNWDDRPIIYYHSSTFFVDLSAESPDLVPELAPVGDHDRPILGARTEYREKGLGDDMKQPLDSHTSQLAVEKGGEPILQIFEGRSDVRQDLSLSPAEPFELEASGVGGVLPRDNFVINVSVKRTPATTSLHSNPIRPSKRPRRYKFNIASVRHTLLPPSSLPPPSYIFLPSSPSSEDSGDDYSSTHDSNSESEWSISQSDMEAPPSFLRSLSTASSDVTSSGEDESEESMDLLTTARALDPDGIARYEQEFEYISQREPENERHVPMVSDTSTTDTDSGSDLASSEESVGESE